MKLVHVEIIMPMEVEVEHNQLEELVVQGQTEMVIGFSVRTVTMVQRVLVETVT